jgi:hypothetical protein
MSKTDKRISDLTVDEFTALITDIIDQRISTLLDPDGELRDDFIEELLKRKNQPDLVGIDEVWSD